MPASAAPNAARAAKTTYQRSVFLIDPAYQLREVSRNIAQFTVLLLVQLGAFGLVAYLDRAEMIRPEATPLLYIAVAFCAPMALCVLYSLTTIRRSHRVAGAAFRLASDIPRILTDPTFRFHLREGDYLDELKEELNKVIEAIEARSESLTAIEENLVDLEQALAPLHAKLSVTESEAAAKCVDRMRGAVEVLRARVTQDGTPAES